MSIKGQKRIKREDIAKAFVLANADHQVTTIVFEHDQFWVNCNICGVQYSVVEAQGPGSYNGIGFEEVTPGDGECGRRRLKIKRNKYA